MAELQIQSPQLAQQIAHAMLRVVVACHLLPQGHPGIARAAQEFVDLLATAPDELTLGITSKGLCDAQGTLLESEPSDLSRVLHSAQFGRIVLRKQNLSLEVALRACEALADTNAADGPGIEVRLAERSARAITIVPLQLGSIKATRNAAGTVPTALAEEGSLLIRALLSSDASELTPESLAKTITASLALRDDNALQQADAWRMRLCAGLDALATVDSEQAALAKGKVAQAITELDPRVRSLLLDASASPQMPRALRDQKQIQALRLSETAEPLLSKEAVLNTIEQASSSGVLSPEAVMLCVKLGSITRSEHSLADRSDEVLRKLQRTIEDVLRDPAAHGYSPDDYRARLVSLSRSDNQHGIAPPFAARDVDASVQASCIASSIVQQARELGYDPTGSIRFLTQRAASLAASNDDAAIAALASVMHALPSSPSDAQSASQVQIAADALRAALADTKCLLPLIKRTGRDTPCEHAMVIIGSLPALPIVPLAEQYMMSGAIGLRRTLDIRLRAMPVASVVELAQGLVQHQGVTPHLLALLENLDPSRAHASMIAILKDTPAPQRRSLLESLHRSGAAMPPGLVATALIDDDVHIVTIGLNQLSSMQEAQGAFAIHAAFTHLDGSKRLSASRVDMLCKVGVKIGPLGAQAIASLVDAWRWSLTGHRPRACAIMAGYLKPFVAHDPAIEEVLSAWARSSGRLVEWLMPGSGDNA